MSFDLNALRLAVAEHGRVARVVITQTRGSVPRESGTAMLVWKNGFSGTIGGGTLEHEALSAAREALTSGKACLRAVPLGPGVGQCCGGHVTWLVEFWDEASLQTIGDPVARRLPDGPPEMPFGVRRALAKIRQGNGLNELRLIDGWVIEPISTPQRTLWLYGAGHVGRAIVGTMAPLPDWTIGWVDTGPERFPEEIPPGVRALPAPDPMDAVALAPEDAHHLVLTYSHALDLALVAAVLARSHGSLGLIGSATKWVRFRRRLLEMNLSLDLIDTVRCPIGDPDLGKHPQAIALGVASELIALSQRKKTRTQGPGRLSSRGET